MLLNGEGECDVRLDPRFDDDEDRYRNHDHHHNHDHDRDLYRNRGGYYDYFFLLTHPSSGREDVSGSIRISS